MAEPTTGTMMMDFPTALREVIKGKKITKASWKNPQLYVLLKDNYLRHRKADGVFDALIISETDLLAEDWVILLEQ